MTRSHHNANQTGRLWGQVSLFIGLISLAITPSCARAQGSDDPAVQNRIQMLTQSVDRIEEQLQQSQRELAALKEQLQLLRGQGGQESSSQSAASTDAATLADAVANLRESQAVNESQIATLAQSKVETESRYPLKLTGMVLLNGFVNTQRVDSAPSPAIALGGSGSTGATLQNTIIGLDANGPHVLGATSHADLRLDFSGAPASGAASGYSSAILRLRTLHAMLDWSRTRAFFALDKTLLNPGSPTSIAAVALPPLAWSGNLWSWNPRIGVMQDILPVRSGALRFQANLTDVSDPPPLFASTQTSTYTPPPSGEQSRWPGAEGRFAYESGDERGGARLGISAFFAPHRTATSARRYNSWATASDFRIPMGRLMELSGNAYYGAALGSLGAGDYKNIVLRTVAGEQYLQVLDNVGGWAQWKERAGERLEFNQAFGIDTVPAHQLRPYAISTPVSYYNLARNRTFTANAIYSPSTYFVFSLEYRHIASSYVTAPTSLSDVVNIAAGYKF